jgi:hypothetical protein
VEEMERGRIKMPRPGATHYLCIMLLGHDRQVGACDKSQTKPAEEYPSQERC